MLNITGTSLELPMQASGGIISHMQITIGASLCSSPTLLATSADGRQVVQCRLEAAEAGVHALRVVNMLGTAGYKPAGTWQVKTAWFTVSLDISTIVPGAGSIGGGAVATLIGEGFTHDVRDVTVTFDRSKAAVRFANRTHIEVVSPPAENTAVPLRNSSALVSLTINEQMGSTMFFFDSTKTILLKNFSTSSSVITISGEYVGRSSDTTASATPVSPDTMVCKVATTSLPMQQVTATSLMATLPSLEAGQYRLLASLGQHGDGVWEDDADSVLTVALSVSSISPTMFGHGGGESVVIAGSGFPTSCSGTDLNSAATFVVRVCSAECIVTEKSHNRIVCTVPASPTALRNTSRDFTKDESCLVAVAVGTHKVNATQTILYQASKTSVINDVSPRRGGTAGGTKITLLGTLVKTANATVMVDGSSCNITFINASMVQCVTTAHRTTLIGTVHVHVPGIGLSVEKDLTTVISSTHVEGSAYFQYIDRWSSRYTWGGQHPPAEGESVSIRRGQTVLLDTSTPELNLIILQGDLIFDDAPGVLLQAKYIFIHGGSLRVRRE